MYAVLINMPPEWLVEVLHLWLQQNLGLAIPENVTADTRMHFADRWARLEDITTGSHYIVIRAIRSLHKSIEETKLARSFKLTCRKGVS